MDKRGSNTCMMMRFAVAALSGFLLFTVVEREFVYQDELVRFRRGEMFLIGSFSGREVLETRGVRLAPSTDLRRSQEIKKERR
jgi:hypothetical protein